jgi:hypothetical protein
MHVHIVDSDIKGCLVKTERCYNAQQHGQKYVSFLPADKRQRPYILNAYSLAR